ncbi:hypothetical protein H8959_014342 [Pygathrix nigripes]
MELQRKPIGVDIKYEALIWSSGAGQYVAFPINIYPAATVHMHALTYKCTPLAFAQVRSQAGQKTSRGSSQSPYPGSRPSFRRFQTHCSRHPPLPPGSKSQAEKQTLPLQGQLPSQGGSARSSSLGPALGLGRVSRWVSGPRLVPGRPPQPRDSLSRPPPTVIPLVPARLCLALSPALAFLSPPSLLRSREEVAAAGTWAPACLPRPVPGRGPHLLLLLPLLPPLPPPLLRLFLLCGCFTSSLIEGKASGR